MTGFACLIKHPFRRKGLDTLGVSDCSGLPLMGPSAGQALLNQLRSAAQAQPQPQVRPDQLTGAGAALLAQLQARSLAQQQQAMPQAAGLTNPGMNLLAQLQRVSGGLPSGGVVPPSH